ncbi:hypothetical protein ACFL2O_09055 [Thermodesulfobacteriota bacterium]
MRYKLLIFGFLSSIAIMILIVVYALSASQQILVSFEQGEKHFKDITTAATEVSSYAKKAEGHLFLYLVLHRKTDKERFPERIASLHGQISILDAKIKNPEAEAILKKIKKNTGGLLPAGNALISDHDKTLKKGGEFNLDAYWEEIFKLHENFLAVRKNAVELAEFEIRSEDKLKSSIFENTARLRLFLLLLIILITGFTLYLGYVLNRMITTLNKEIASRKEAEGILQEERNKLIEALDQVKVLSGLIPICSSCKKVRDDKGYWNKIESYLRNHSELEFTHGICPECAKKIYSDFYREREE